MQKAGRGVAPMRDFPVLLWLVLALVSAAAEPFLREATWVMTHLVLLGAMTHAVLVWSTFFAQALLRTPDTVDPRSHQTARQSILIVGVLGVIVGVPAGWWNLVLVAACVVGAAVLWHSIAMLRRLRAALPSRFAVTVRYYLVASLCLPVGAVFGVLLARWPATDLFGRLLTAHTTTMLLGWLGLTVMGTLVTFWPTMLRTRVDPRAASFAQRALPLLIAGIVFVDVGAVVAVRAVVVVGLILYLLGTVWWGRGLIVPLRAAPPTRAPGLFATAALAWGLVILVSLPLHVAMSDSWGDVTAGYLPITTVAVLGFALQLLTAALSQLIPTVLGGGPVVVKAVQAEFARGVRTRITVINVSLIVAMLPLPGVAERIAIACAILTAAMLVPILLRGIIVGVRTRRSLAR